MEDDVIEGFICPICIIDLKSPAKLSAHFEAVHPDDRVVYQQLKSVFSKAKRKILKKTDTPTTTTNAGSVSGPAGSTGFISHGTPASGGIDLALWNRQTEGFTFSHTKHFRDQRKEAIERYVVETNKLIIRLEKLIKSGIYASDSSLPGTIKTRKNVEKSVVPWDSDSNVKECPNCNKKFSMTYRRHHCRLCGKVVCERCMDNVDMTIACGVLKLDTQQASSYVKFTPADSESDNGLKICDPCNELLVRQNKLRQDKSANTTLLQLYDRMQTSMKEADNTLPKYIKIADSLNAGETEFNLENATEMRLKLLKSYESIEALSKRIQQLGLEKDKISQQLIKLQRSIRQYASKYLSENMFILPALPTQDKYAELLKEKDLERERMKTERTLAAQSPKTSRMKKQTIENTESKKDINKNSLTEKSSGFINGLIRGGSSKSNSSSKELRPIQAVSISKSSGSSWGPVQVSTTNKQSSAVGQQIEIVKGYLIQARQAGKNDEVKLFEDNLNELMKLDLEQKEMVPDEVNYGSY